MAKDSRFERIERHLDDLSKDIKELTKVVADLARIEERMVTLFKRMDSLVAHQRWFRADKRTLEIIRDNEERAAAQAVVDSTPEEVKVFDN